MPFDRSRFLLLTAAIAAGGCDRIKSRIDDVRGEPEPDPAAAPNDPGQNTGAAAAQKTGQNGQNTGVTTPGPHGKAAPAGARKTSDGVHPTGEGTGGPTSEGMGDMGPTAEGTANNQPGGGWGTCSNDAMGSPADCATLNPPGGHWPQPNCPSFPAAHMTCDRMRMGLRPRIAQSAVACMMAASGQAPICDPRTPNRCMNQAIAGACIEPASVQRCNDIASGCGWHPPGIQACEQLLSSLQPAQRTAAISCMTEGCDAHACGPAPSH